MQHFEKALKMAIEAGFDKTLHIIATRKIRPNRIIAGGISEDVSIPSVLLDPKFFQALGKAMGWGETEIYDRITGEPVLTMYWRLKQYEFIDHLAEGKDPDSFFQALLTNQ